MDDSKKKSQLESISSPCIRNCCLNNNDICIGCFRHLDEIIGWQERSNNEKKLIIEKCQKRAESSSDNSF